MMSAIANSIWEGDGLGARAARLMLAPAERVFASIVARRNAEFDGAPARKAVLPAISVGNLTVGGTGKTPVAAWCTSQLRRRGAKPSIVLRGYGDDEWRVHALLNPDVPVIVSVDRVAGMTTARTRGADCAVLDDAFQHRRAPRVADLVLVSADQWREPIRMLPAGPFREPLSALQRASVIVVTVKSATPDLVDGVCARVTQVARDIPVAVVRLAPGKLRLAATLGAATAASGARQSNARTANDSMLSHAPEWLAGRAVVALSAVGDPSSFAAQMRALGADIRHDLRYADHHAFSAADASRAARLAEGTSGVICTLKDAVKLQALWPREAPPLWYVSQSVVVDRGAEALDRVFTRVLAARTATALTAG